MIAPARNSGVAGLLEVRDVAIGYGGRVVIAGLELMLQPRRTIGLLGINGAGKSTTLKGVAGVLRPHAGSILLNGTELFGRTAAQNARAGLVLVPEGARSFHDMSVLENLEMGGFVISNSLLLRRRCDEIFEWFPRLRERAALRAGSLSGGERQMLAIARALMLRPKVLLLDEPFLGLAPIMIAEIKSLIQRVQSETGCGILVAEQLVAAILPICDEAFVLRNGEPRSVNVSEMLQVDEAVLATSIFGVAAD